MRFAKSEIYSLKIILVKFANKQIVLGRAEA